MSWRETLSVDSSLRDFSTHNSQNTHKPGLTDISANNADIADSESNESSSNLAEWLETACIGLDISPLELNKALTHEDIQDWKNGDVSLEAMSAFALALSQRKSIDAGKRPTNYTERAICKQCGPIWLWQEGTVYACPWCSNRLAGNPIPRPSSVRCIDCIHFRRINHPRLGHCSMGKPGSVAGLWDTNQRYCDRYLPCS